MRQVEETNSKATQKKGFGQKILQRVNPVQQMKGLARIPFEANHTIRAKLIQIVLFNTSDPFYHANFLGEHSLNCVPYGCVLYGQEKLLKRKVNPSSACSHSGHKI
ncbi:hypothetical protein CDAR_538021 [Caerostris darwini]|uniref:Uncharacterized protein n=1 Tax=Caerostris darwini TaxID=1538125 RepID=A0AAV4TCA6_9ARAC|nr:hypothetical protein CDAR_538021 [Caerostris darwini]